MSNPTSSRPSPGHVLAVYAEPLVRGRRVALVAHGGEAMGDLLLSLGARLLYVYDPDESGVRKVSERVSVASFRGGELGVRDGAFDVVIIPDLGRIGDAEATLAQVRRLVGPQGVAVIACRNPEAGEGWLSAGLAAPGPTYGEFYDLCALQFSEVRMIGAAPFAGYAVAEFAPEREPAITFDPTLVAGAEPPEWYIAVASQHAVVALDPYEIVQVPRRALVPHEPVAPPAPPAAPAAPSVDEGRILAVRDALAAAQQKLHEAEARAGSENMRAERLANEVRVAQEESSKHRDRSTKLAKDFEDERRARQKAEAELAIAAPEASAARSKLLAFEAELIEARTQLATPRVPPADFTKLAHERDRAQADLAATSRSRDAVQSELAAVGRSRDALQSELAAALKSRDVALAELAAMQRSAEQTRRAADELKSRLAEREVQLEAAHARARGLEARVHELLTVASRGETARGELEQLRARVQGADAIVARAQAEVAAILEAHERDVRELEHALRARGEELRAARVELGRRERMVRELVSQIEELHAGVAPPAPAVQVESSAAAREEIELARRELGVLVEEVRRRDRAVAELRATYEKISRELDAERAKTTELARDAARREAALQTASWRIVELEKLGADAPDALESRDSRESRESPDAASERTRLESELDALRSALAQENERRERLERAVAAGGSESDLARALARLDEREALIAQLSAELAARSAGGGLGG
jgi:hypothetical protein